MEKIEKAANFVLDSQPGQQIEKVSFVARTLHFDIHPILMLISEILTSHKGLVFAILVMLTAGILFHSKGLQALLNYSARMEQWLHFLESKFGDVFTYSC